jgi:hypothetical protein
MMAGVPPRFLTDCDPGDETAPPIVEWSVLVWRFDCLIRAGYPDELAVRLAENAAVDLHDAVELLYRGCPVGAAERILS